MKKNKTNIILAIIFLIGLSVMLYPTISDYWNSRVQSQAVAAYNNDVQNMSKEDYQRMFSEADEYNEELKDIAHPFENYGEIPGYEDILNVSGTGIIGYVTIDKLKTELPIYHGTSEGVLQVGVGHLEGSSFPVGGIGTHAVSNLDEMEEGDTFQVTVLNRVLTYQVDQIHIVEPGDVDDLKVDPQKDYCTLMTCTPYGINTHRLLVRGVRVDGNANAYVPADAYQIEPNVVAVWTTIVITIVMTFISVVMWAAKRRKGIIPGKKHEEV